MQKRALQAILFLLSLIPLIGVTIGFGPGVGFFFDGAGEFPVRLDNQFRYLSGVYASVTLAIWWTLPKIEERVMPLRIAATGVVLGAVGRLISMATLGDPGDPTMVAGVGLEAVVVPLLLVWHARLAKAHREQTAGASAASSSGAGEG